MNEGGRGAGAGVNKATGAFRRASSSAEWGSTRTSNEVLQRGEVESEDKEELHKIELAKGRMGRREMEDGGSAQQSS